MTATRDSATAFTAPLGDDAKTLAAGALRRLSRITPERVFRHAGIQLERAQKRLVRTLTLHPVQRKTPVFISGSNRSGTQMVCRAIGNSPHGWDYPEADFSIAFERYSLRSHAVIDRLIRWSPAPLVSFGSILDSQFTDALLDRFQNSRAIWVFRRYEDAVNSSIRSWGGHQKNMMRQVSQGRLSHLGPRGLRIADENVELIRSLYSESLTDEDAGCLYWYMRNKVFFDLGLDRNPRVMALQYEDAVLNQERAFRSVFHFLGCPYHESVISDVFATSVGKQDWKGASAEISALCDGLKARLDAHHARTLNAWG
jgi:hypothetical protein